LLLSLLTGGIVLLNRQIREREILVSELRVMGVQDVLTEATGLTQVVMKFSPGRHRWLIEHLGWGWFERPTVFRCLNLEDEKIPIVVERLRRLGTVRELHADERLSAAAMTSLRAGLPGVNVVPQNDYSQHTYFHSQVYKAEHLAVEGLILTVAFFLSLIWIVVSTTRTMLAGRRNRARAETT
jgi:hypothetical protein